MAKQKSSKNMTARGCSRWMLAWTALALASALVGDSHALTPKPAPVRRLRLSEGDANRLPLLSAFADPSTDRRAARFLAGPWGMRRWQDWASRYELHPIALGWTLQPDTDREPQAPWDRSPSAEELTISWMVRPPLCPSDLPWRLSALMLQVAPEKKCTRRPVSLVRLNAEADHFSLLDCDGSVTVDALDRLSVMLRPVGTQRPELPLPDAPDGQALEPGEWLPSVRMVHPRLVWLLQQVANAFPSRSLYVVSGYRKGEHEGLHGKGRAVDISVMGITNEDLYAMCRSLRDVGCGYYPHHNFVHLDVRRSGSGKAYWIDDSRPSEPSHYVDGWPGVEEPGGTGWVGEPSDH